MADRFPVGVSSYDDDSATSPHGKTQTVASAVVAQQVASLCYEFDTEFPGAAERGDRLTVNEGIREKPRQVSLRAAWEHYRDYGSPWAALAAALYTSTHRPEIGSALDFGITQADGTNRAMTEAEAQWVHDRGVRRGIVWTGRLFVPQERWHHNGGYVATIAPIAGVNQPGAPLPTTTVTAAAKPPVQEDTMLAIKNTQNGALFGVSVGRVRHCSTQREFDLIVKATPGNVAQATDPATLTQIFRAHGIPVEAIDPVWITRHPDTDSDGHTWSAIGQLKDALAASGK
ncbi:MULTISPECIES: hypothetical protein [unclassified Curtobacterium]|uniref:hypothetical protein n=1 Tax=unclassified Curtobacterium TaxID=257496 RepID=UPI0038147C61